MLTTDPLPYAAFIARHLMRPVGPRLPGTSAVAETEAVFAGDRWFWADDNAKVLEFLSLPAVRRAHPEAEAAAFGFLRALCDGPFIYRRVGEPRLEAAAGDAASGVARFLHTFLDIGCDLPRGMVTAGVRFHDGRTARNLVLSGNYVRFTHGKTIRTLDVEDAIADWQVQRNGTVLELSHRSELRFDDGGVTRRLGSLRQAARFDARSTVIHVEAVLDLDPGVTVSDVVLTIAADDLSHGDLNIAYDTIRVERPAGAPLLIRPAGTTEQLHPLDGAAYWSMARDGAMRGFAPAIHSLPREAGSVSALRVVGREGGLLHWVAMEHGFPGAHRGGRLVAAEAKVLTSGGFYDRAGEYAAVMRAEIAAAPTQPLDLSLSYDYGVELAAFARRARVLAGEGPAAAAAMEEAVALHDRTFAAYEANVLAAAEANPRAVFSRPLSFVALGLADMLAATGAERYRTALARVTDVLLSFERGMTDAAGGPIGAFPMGHGEEAYLDCHAAALLALVRAMPALDDPRLAAAVDRGLGAYLLSSDSVEFNGPTRTDGVAVGGLVDGRRIANPGFWNYAAGLSLRGFNALRRAPSPALRAVGDRHAHRIALFETIMRGQIARSLHARGDALEIRTSVLSGETNSETQPWVAMALVAEPGDEG